MRMVALVASAVAATVATAASGETGPSSGPAFKVEKCYGVAAAGKNDCSSTGAHSCAGESKIARDPKSWIYVPVGTCRKIEGGSTTPKDS